MNALITSEMKCPDTNKMNTFGTGETNVLDADKMNIVPLL